jgi:hypothetical protein
MAQKFVNDWLGDVEGTDAGLFDAIYSMQPRDWIRAVRRIRDFQGTKVMLACTDRTPLAEVIKQAVCFADLVILVPAPLWVSCAYPVARPYAEFNYESIGLPSCNVSEGLLQNLSGLIAEEAEVFDDGAITFLPVLGKSQHRWSDPELGLPELPRPYSGAGGDNSPLSVHVEALYGLCNERLAAERLGAMHLNSASFTEPVFGDLTIGKQLTGEWVHYLWEMSVPDLSMLSLSDVARVRRELPEAASEFSRATRRVLGSGNAGSDATNAMVEDQQNSATTLTQQIELALALFGKTNHLRKTTVVFGSRGPQDNISATVDFLLGGGSLADLARLITASGDKRLELREDSFWAASY